MAEAVKALTETGAQELLSKHGKKKAESMMEGDQCNAFMAYLKAESYHSFVLKRRESKNITATLKEAHPVLEIEPGLLDKDWFLLCTPKHTYDLRKGLTGMSKSISPMDSTRTTRHILYFAFRTEMTCAA